MACNLIPGIPDDIALRCLARLPLASHNNARAVCRPWRSALLTDELYQVRRCEGLSESWIYIYSTARRYSISRPVLKAYEALSQHWHSLPPLPTRDFRAVDFGMAVSSMIQESFRNRWKGSFM
ncbi:hypothetical protein O6H91_01G074800 [Diphasiastrum complanatum]|uniref:Uncharacterized protein n=1 Tax=Diphasiastrum complanatum TaxID=34168 RepID=A0ACC2ESA7_DIPCM|nr:hypothetical protein O6H91_01G074800 [Diphasiastrum complanatum]